MTCLGAESSGGGIRKGCGQPRGSADRYTLRGLMHTTAEKERRTIFPHPLLLLLLQTLYSGLITFRLNLLVY